MFFIMAGGFYLAALLIKDGIADFEGADFAHFTPICSMYGVFIHNYPHHRVISQDMLVNTPYMQHSRCFSRLVFLVDPHECVYIYIIPLLYIMAAMMRQDNLQSNLSCETMRNLNVPSIHGPFVYRYTVTRHVSLRLIFCFDSSQDHETYGHQCPSTIFVACFKEYFTKNVWNHL